MQYPHIDCKKQMFREELIAASTEGQIISMHNILDLSVISPRQMTLPY